MHVQQTRTIASLGITTTLHGRYDGVTKTLQRRYACSPRTASFYGLRRVAATELGAPLGATPYHSTSLSSNRHSSSRM